jgi:UPF0113 PUA domain
MANNVNPFHQTFCHHHDKVWVKPNGEMPFLYGNHVLKAHLGRITEDTPEHQGVVVYSMNDVPLVNGLSYLLQSVVLSARAGIRSHVQVNCRYTKIGPDSHRRFSSGVRILITFSLPPLKPSFFLRDVGEYLRDEVTRNFTQTIVYPLTYLPGYLVLIQSPGLC